MQDESGLSFLGYLFERLQYESFEGKDDEYEKLTDFTSYLLDDMTIDMHKEQFVNTGTLKKKISAWQLIFKNIRHHREQRWFTEMLMYKGQEQDNYELTEKEKNTLFKNACKLLIAHSNDIHQVWLKKCDYLMKCDVNIFEMKDKNGEGIEHKLTKAWPTQISRSRYFQAILKSALTPQMRQEQVNGQALIYKKIVQGRGLIRKIFAAGMFTAKLVLTLDS
jgi:hypothetical protein